VSLKNPSESLCKWSEYSNDFNYLKVEADNDEECAHKCYREA